ncbi:hypothetical protein [Desulfovibrio sp. SGI.169]|uniref:hypothetical protein n=1 Tax=Desulfovibrio sp. SGI.169 TaxID=3420561 RepID=UPI003CFC0FC4
MNDLPNITIETAAPRRGRRPLDAAPDDSRNAEAALAEQAAAPVVADLRAQSLTMPKAELAQSLSLAQGLGMFQAFDLISQFTGLARLKWLAERKQSGDYKGITVTDRHGQSLHLNTFEDLCSYIGLSRGKVYEDLQNLTLLGESFMATAETLNLGYRDLRLLRQGIAELPPAEREAILAEVDAADGPEAMKDKLAELKLELARAKVEKKEMEETLAAKEKVSKDKGERLDALEEKINRLTSMAPDDQQKALNDINAGAREGVDKKYQQVFLAVVELIGHCATMLTDDRITEESCAYVHERVGQLMDTVANMVLRAGIDVDLRARFELPGEDEPRAGNGAE